MIMEDGLERYKPASLKEILKEFIPNLYGKNGCLLELKRDFNSKENLKKYLIGFLKNSTLKRWSIFMT